MKAACSRRRASSSLFINCLLTKPCVVGERYTLSISVTAREPFFTTRIFATRRGKTMQHYTPQEVRNAGSLVGFRQEAGQGRKVTCFGSFRDLHSCTGESISEGV